jgi:peroxiredoxin
MTQPTIEVLSQAKELLRAGQKQDARNLLGKYLQQNPLSEEGWWLMSFAVANQDQQIQCLKKILQINPDRQKVRKKLEELTGEKQVVKQAIGQASSNHNAPHLHSKSKKFFSWRWIAPLLVCVLIIISLMIYFGYRKYSDSPVNTQAQAISPQSSPTHQYAGLPPTWTNEAPTLTMTPLPTSTETPAPTGTPTPDPNATRTPLPGSWIGTKAGVYPPDFALKDVVTGEEISIRDYKGQPVLITFFTTWCPICKGEMPRIQEIYERYRSQGFVVLGVGVNESESSVRNYGSRYTLSFPIMADSNSKVASEYLVRGVPTHYFIRTDGKIGFVQSGPITEANLSYFLTKP